MTIKVRTAAPADLKALLRMVDAHNAYSGMTGAPLDIRNFRGAIFGKASFLFCDIAEADGEFGVEVVGYALSHDCFTTDDGTRGVYLADLFVEEAWRREGAGRRLVGAVARRARQRGATHVWWTSQTRNFQARRFYKKLDASDQAVHAHALDGVAFEAVAGAKAPDKPRPAGAAKRR